MRDQTFYRLTLAALAALALLLGTATNANAAQSLRVYPTCEKSWRTNGTAHRTCQMTATHHRTGTKRWPVLVTFKDRCHLATWRTGSKVGPTKGEGIRATCWERGRFVTYYI